MNKIKRPSAINPIIAQTPNPFPLSPGVGGFGGSGGSIGSTVIPSTEVMLGVNATLPSSRLKDPVNYRMKLFPRIIETISSLA